MSGGQAGRGARAGCFVLFCAQRGGWWEVMGQSEKLGPAVHVWTFWSWAVLVPQSIWSCQSCQ